MVCPKKMMVPNFMGYSPLDDEKPWEIIGISVPSYIFLDTPHMRDGLDLRGLISTAGIDTSIMKILSMG